MVGARRSRLPGTTCVGRSRRLCQHERATIPARKDARESPRPRSLDHDPAAGGPMIDTNKPPLRVMALHALEYCQRLFYLEEVEEIRVADARVYAGRELHASLGDGEDGERTELELADPALGLVG